ncbi:MAG TPA: TIGR03564 family F420-dependent LLM class oxidoreductase [Polyangiales bacterium]|jgi:F420-dependent oxidoreductase-like protein|nr:TIGR03564 family F420-dependent LLM class oxidoreductase [Polyangiales bacterium]
MRIGIGIGDIAGRPADIGSIVAQAKEAEASGFASVWIANIFGFDALTLAAVVGAATERIEIGTGVVPTYPRHPYAMAQQALSVNAAAGGRFALGVGLSHKIVIENSFGMSFAKSYSHMREYLSVLAPLVRTGKVDFDGEQFRVHAGVNVPGSKPCPILIAALAPKMLALAGSVADGTITWMTGPKTLAEHTVPTIVKAAADSGRPAPRVVVGLPVAVSDDAAAAKEMAGKAFRVYGALPSYRAMLDREGAEGPADVAMVGDEAAVSRQIEHLAAIGVTDFMAIPYALGLREARDASIARTMTLLRRHATRA